MKSAIEKRCQWIPGFSIADFWGDATHPRARRSWTMPTQRKRLSRLKQSCSFTAKVSWNRLRLLQRFLSRSEVMHQEDVVNEEKTLCGDEDIG